MDLRKAISPILATVILIAVTLVIAIGVIGWIMGIWGSLGGPSESLVVTGGGTGVGKDGKLYFSLTIVNKGSGTAKLSRIEVSGIGSTTTYCGSGVTEVDQCSSLTTPLDQVEIPPGRSDTILTAVGQGYTCVAGATYNVNVYTQAGNVYSTVIRVTDCVTTQTGGGGSSTGGGAGGTTTTPSK